MDISLLLKSTVKILKSLLFIISFEGFAFNNKIYYVGQLDPLSLRLSHYMLVNKPVHVATEIGSLNRLWNQEAFPLQS